MPLYKNNLTGLYEDMSEQTASAYDYGVFEMIAEESGSEEAARLKLEALENKVDLELPGDKSEEHGSEEAPENPGDKSEEAVDEQPAIVISENTEN